MEFPGEKLLIKIWESVIDSGVASLLRPWQIGREGRAKIEIERLSALRSAQVQNEITAIRRGADTIDGRGQLTGESRVNWSNSRVRAPSGKGLMQLGHLKQELNLERIIAHAIEHASTVDDKYVSADPVDEDWLARWKRNAENISDERMQEIWAKILAGEIQKPGRYSLQTLNMLAVISEREAKLIESYSRSVVFGGSLMNLETDERPVEEICELADLGFLSRYQGNLGLMREAHRTLEGSFRCVDCWSVALICEMEDANAGLTIPVLNLSRAGIELLELGNFEPDLDQLKRTALDLMKPNALLSMTKIKRVGVTPLNKAGGHLAFRLSTTEWLS